MSETHVSDIFRSPGTGRVLRSGINRTSNSRTTYR